MEMVFAFRFEWGKLRRSIVFDNFLYGSTTNGAYIAAGDVSGDGKADLITGAGSGSDIPQVLVNAFPAGWQPEQVHNFLAYDPGFQGGVRVGGVDANGDGRADIITAPGPGYQSEVKVFDAVDGTPITDLPSVYTGFVGGVYTNGNDLPIGPQYAPKFEALSSAISVDDKAPIDTVVADINAADAEGDNFVFSIDPNSGVVPFIIDENTGVIKVSETIDYDLQASYTFTILATDQPYSNVAAMSITIDVNKLSFGADTYQYSEPETRAVNSLIEDFSQKVIGGAFTGPLTYSLSGASYPFTVDSTTGQFRLAGPLDYETKTSYQLLLTVTNSLGESDTATLDIA